MVINTTSSFFQHGKKRDDHAYIKVTDTDIRTFNHFTNIN
jgi:hypothetical protein